MRRKSLLLLIIASLAGFGGLCPANQNASSRLNDSARQLLGSAPGQLSGRVQGREQSPGSRPFGLGPQKLDGLPDPMMFGMLSSAGQAVILRRNNMLSDSQRKAAISSQALSPPPPSLDQIVNNTALDFVADTQSETSICASGSNIVESFNDTSEANFKNTPSFDGYAFSNDGGKTWTHQQIPQAPGQQNAGDGVVAAGPHGEIYYCSLLLTGPRLNTSAIGVAKSTDGGKTFTTPVDASTTDDSSDTLNDKDWIAVDRGAASSFSGNVYVAWTRLGVSTGGDPHTTIKFVRSTDGGKTFSQPLAISRNIANESAGDRPQGANIAVSPDGSINVAYYDRLINGGAVIAYTKSTDGGLHFSTPVAIAFLLDNSAFGIGTPEMTGIGDVRSNSWPMIAAGPDGGLHIVYDAQPALLGPDRSDVFYQRSTDGGATFSTPRKINDDKTTTTQMLPAIAVTANNAVGVKWWDRRNDPTGDHLTDVYMTISSDGGTTFGHNFRVSKQNFIYTPIERIVADGYHGDYDGMTADGDNFFVPWSGEWRGNPDAYFAEVPASTNPLGPDFAIAAKNAVVSVVAGNSAECSIGITPVGGFSGNLTFSALSQVDGVSATFAESGGVTTVHIQTSANTPPGSYMYAIAATDGADTRGTTLWLNVLSASTSFVSLPSNISNTSGFSRLGSAPVIDSRGNIHVVFYDDSDDANFGFKLYYERSSDGGRTYSPRVQVSADGDNASAPTLRVDESGNIYVIWERSDFLLIDGLPERSFGTLNLSVSRDGGQAFAEPVTLPNSLFLMTSFDVDDDGTLVFTYSSVGLYCIRSTDGGATFATEARVNGIDDDNVNPQRVSVLSDHKGYVLVAYADFDGTLFTSVSLDGGLTFPGQEKLTGAHIVAGFQRAALARGPDGVAYILFESAMAKAGKALRNEEIDLAVAPDGRFFGGPIPILQSDLPLFTGPFALGVGADNTVFVALEDEVVPAPGVGAKHGVVVARSTDRGSSFSIASFVLPPSFFAVPEEILLGTSQGGTVNVALVDDGLAPSPQLFFSRSTDGGVTFSGLYNVSNDPGTSQSPFLGVLPDNSVSLLWLDDSYESTQVASATVAPPGLATPGFSLIDQGLTIPGPFSTQLVISVSRPGQFQGNVTVSAPTNLPKGISISPAQVSTATTNATFTLNVKQSTKAKTYPLTFTGTASGARSSGTIMLTVTK